MEKRPGFLFLMVVVSLTMSLPALRMLAAESGNTVKKVYTASRQAEEAAGQITCTGRETEQAKQERQALGYQAL